MIDASRRVQAFGFEHWIISPIRPPPSSPSWPSSPRSTSLFGAGGRDTISVAEEEDKVSGGGGRDTISGGTEEDELSGGNGNDTIVGGPDPDLLSGGAGRDTINARDGVRDTVECGAGVDLARVDRFDVVSGCEQVNRR